MRRTLSAAPAALVLLLSVGLAACSSTKPAVKGDDPSSLPEPKERLAAKPYITLFDALEKVWLPGGGFAPGEETIYAPIHSGTNATLFYFATRGDLPKHVHHAHEETLFIYEGSGALLLAGEKTIALEPGLVVRIPPGVCHGFRASRTDAIKAIAVVGPSLESSDWEPADADVPGTTDRVFAIDASSTKALDALDPEPDSQVKRRFLHQSKWSTLQVAAVRRDAIPDHRHGKHDETVIVFAQAGLGFLRLNEVVHIVQPGSVAHAPAGTVHSFQHQAEGHTRAISIFTPGYDGTDVQMVQDWKNEDLKAPPGYKKTRVDEFGGGRADEHLRDNQRGAEKIQVGPNER